MRLRTLFKLLVLGLSAGAVTHYVRGRRTSARRDDLAPDPGDPVQGFDEVPELQVSELAVDALSTEDVEAAQDLARLEAELDRVVGDDEVAVELVDIEDVAVIHDSGELYGAHTPIAVDRAHVDDDEAFVEGQNWVEALETSAIENGTEPERSLDEIVDDEDLLRPPHAALHRDVPVADHGSGGRRGL
jgi:hypothetical protein